MCVHPFFLFLYASLSLGHHCFNKCSFRLQNTFRLNGRFSRPFFFIRAIVGVPLPSLRLKVVFKALEFAPETRNIVCELNLEAFFEGLLPRRRFALEAFFEGLLPRRRLVLDGFEVLLEGQLPGCPVLLDGFEAFLQEGDFALELFIPSSGGVDIRSGHFLLQSGLQQLFERGQALRRRRRHLFKGLLGRWRCVVHRSGLGVGEDAADRDEAEAALHLDRVGDIPLARGDGLGALHRVEPAHRVEAVARLEVLRLDRLARARGESVVERSPYRAVVF
mmetsp:Transcript_16206/g.37550  ORF Transcript_16206/g.37550 Transcript_16206/m.37550 type:complete len:277 (-) Transcript_16206:1464-2294(-)